MRDRFPDGTLLTDLHGYSPGRPATPLTAFDGFLRAPALAPGQIPVDLEQRAAAYRSLLDDRRVLVVLDNGNSPNRCARCYPRPQAA